MVPKKTTKKPAAPKPAAPKPATTTAATSAAAAPKKDDPGMFGNDYPYYKYIKTPSQMGMSSKGDLNTLGKDVTGIIEYVNVLTSGTSKASRSN